MLRVSPALTMARLHGHGAALAVFALVVAPLRAQEFAWSRQLGTPVVDSASLAAEDGAGGVYVGGNTGASLGGPSAGSEDAWIARYDRSGSQVWIRQFGTIAIDTVLYGSPDGSNG